mgnify:FL=1|jgi:uncharacterized tellurite resistance protein B-like protein
MSSSAIWEKYRKESQQTICVVGVLILAAKLCKNDGHFNTQEEEEILKIIPHNPQQKRILLRILEEGGNDPHPIEYHADRIKKLLTTHDDFLEFIIAVLYRLAYSDHVYSEEEDKDIRKVAEIFNIKQKKSDYLFAEVSKASSNISSKVKNLLGKIYAKSR